MAIRVCVAGASGWTGSAVARAVSSAPDLTLVGAVARRSAGQDVGVVLGGAETGVLVSESVEQALETETDVLVDYTHPEAVKGHALSAIASGVSCVIGTSGLTRSTSKSSRAPRAPPRSVSWRPGIFL